MLNIKLDSSHIHTQSQYAIDLLESLMPYLCYTYIYTLNHKKRDILFLTITLANHSRFL